MPAGQASLRHSFAIVVLLILVHSGVVGADLLAVVPKSIAASEGSQIVKEELNPRLTPRSALHGRFRGEPYNPHADWPAMKLTYRLSRDDWSKFSTLAQARIIRKAPVWKQLKGSLPVSLIVLPTLATLIMLTASGFVDRRAFGP